MSERLQSDVVLVGGGLANGLAALALRRRHPRLRMTMIEAGPGLGGNHTWSFHGSDVDEEGAALLAPLVEWRWPAVRVAFPDHERRLETAYATFTSTALERAVRAALAMEGSALLLGARAVRVAGREVVLADGRRFQAPLVLDARGPAPAVAHAEGTAYQKFLGMEVELEAPMSLDAPLVMDARVAQVDGYRFIYLLPFGPRRLLVEDTYYSDGPVLDRGLVRARIVAYLSQRGLRIGRVLREETGCLPLPLDPRAVPPLGTPLRLGYQGGWLHPTTGYSLSIAARVATTLAEDPGRLAALYKGLQRPTAFCIRLNRLLFRAVPPDQRWAVLSRFYRLPQPTIERFYALTPTAADRARVLCGRPPRGLSWRAALLATQAV
jgi:lycopene beta-cyclase